MNYLRKYGITQEEIIELEERYNENIIKFIKEKEMFITEKIEYLKKEKYIIYTILKNNIRIFLELMYVLKGKIKIMKEKGFSKKHIQMILMDERLYSDIKISKGM